MINLSYGSVCSGIESASVAWESLGFTPSWFSEIEPCPTLTAGDRHAVAFAQNSRNELRLEGGDGQITGCLSASSSAKPGQGHPTIAELSTNLVRRLIPVECERLQGFEDNHTRVPYRNKPAEECPDGPRYKAIGNSKAVPCVRWIGQRLKQHLEELETHGRS